MSRSLARFATAAARATASGAAKSSPSFCSTSRHDIESTGTFLWRRCFTTTTPTTADSAAQQRLARDFDRRRSFASSAAPASNQLAMIKALREKSGAPVTDVKAALVEAQWDEDAAFSALRKRGLAAAAKKASRRAAEGWVSVACSSSSSPSAAAIAEVNCETDFAARNELLTSLASDAAAAALRSIEEPPSSPAGGLASSSVVGASSVPELAPLCSEAAAAAAAAVRENVVVRRVARLSACGGAVVGSYVHSPIAPGARVGRMAAVVALAPLGERESGGAASGSLADADELASLANKLAMHVVAARPLSLDRASLPPPLVESERSIAAAQASASGKPPAIAEKIAAGRLGKWYEEVVLLEQRLVTEDSGKTVAAAAREAGARVVGFARLQVGEGLEEKEGGGSEDFRSEVERLAGGG